ncbi:MAG: N5-glutamine methyltransferase family protein, partial [Alphaproteobacteria bacterium]
MTIATTIHNATQRLAAIGIDTASLDARLLVAHALKLTREEMLSGEERVLTDHERASVEALIARREAREPVSQILGRRGFWRDEFLVTKDVLTPRPESETMIEALLDLRPERDRAYQMLDLGTGSGCLLLSALREYPKSYGTGVDESEAALNVARANAQAL